MVIKVLAIGDIGNYLVTISKYVKKSKIHIINFAKDGAGKFTYDENYELFENYKVIDQVKKINEIKKNYDLVSLDDFLNFEKIILPASDSPYSLKLRQLKLLQDFHQYLYTNLF